MNDKNSFPKKLFFVVVTVVILTLIFVSLWFLSAGKYVESAELYVESGSAFIKENLDDSYVPILGTAVEVVDQTYIKTEQGSFHVVFPNNSIMTLDENTETQINYADGSMNIIQESGSSWHRVKNILEGESYNVETSNTLATVRGTILSVEEDGKGNTIVMVKEGTVEVSKIKRNESGEITKIETKMIEEGTYAFVSDEDEMEIAEITEEMKNTEWYAKNDQYDQMTLEEFLDAVANGGIKVKGAKDVQISFEFLANLLQKIFDSITATEVAPTPTKKPINYGNNIVQKPTATPLPPSPTPIPTPLPSIELSGETNDVDYSIQINWTLSDVDDTYGYTMFVVEPTYEYDFYIEPGQRSYTFFVDEPGVEIQYSICSLDAVGACDVTSNTITIVSPDSQGLY